MYNWLFLFHDPLAQVSPFFYLIDISLFISFRFTASEGIRLLQKMRCAALLFQLSIHLLELGLHEFSLHLFVPFKSFFLAKISQ